MEPTSRLTHATVTAKRPCSESCQEAAEKNLRLDSDVKVVGPGRRAATRARPAGLDLGRRLRPLTAHLPFGLRNGTLIRMTTARSLLLLACLPALALGAPKTGTQVGDEIPKVTATASVVTDAEPRTLQIDSHKTKHPTAYIFVGTTCPATRRYLERMKALETAYQGKVDFVFVYPNRTDSSADKGRFHRDARLVSPMIDDQGAQIAKTLGASRTSEVLLAAKNGILLYRGAIDDSPDPNTVKIQYVRTALDRHLAGKKIETTTTETRA